MNEYLTHNLEHAEYLCNYLNLQPSELSTVKKPNFRGTVITYFIFPISLDEAQDILQDQPEEWKKSVAIRNKLKRRL